MSDRARPFDPSHDPMEDFKAMMFLPEPVAVRRDEKAFTPDAQLVLDLAYGLMAAYGDTEGMVHTVGRTAWVIGDLGESGEQAYTGHAAEPMTRLCTGNTEACWLWPLDAFINDTLGCLRRVRDYYERNGYQRNTNETTEDYAA